MLDYIGKDNAPCFSNGCSLFSDFKIYGLSLWIFGLGAFSTLLVFANWHIAIVFAALDCVFLVLMLFGLPCVNCLLAGLLFLSSFIAITMADHRGFDFIDKLVISCWIILCAANLGALSGEYGDYKIAGESGERLYFSPNCAACAEALKASPSAELYPVAENSEDIDIIYAMEKLLENESDYLKALSMAKANPEKAPFWFEWLLWKNKGRVLEFGGMIPLSIKSGFATDKREYIKNLNFGK